MKHRKHYCYKCGSELFIMEDRKVVSQKSEEAKYYDFSVGVDWGIMLGPCEFIHNIFCCPECLESIEFVTQLSLEDIDIIINKVKKYFAKRGRKIDINKYLET